MDKSEILRKAQSAHDDEFESHIISNSSRIGTISLIVLCTLAAIVEIIRGNGIYQFFAIICGYNFAAITYQFAKFKTKWLLVSSILNGISFVTFTILYLFF